jgi:hypothetical protein
MPEQRFNREEFDELVRGVDARARAAITAFEEALAKPEPTPPEPTAPTVAEVTREIARYRTAISVVQARIDVIENEPSRRLGAIRLAELPGDGADLDELRERAMSLNATLTELEHLLGRLTRGAS